MQTLLLRLEGPLQAWGVRSRWGERDTTAAPTKSGVIGLLGCALGLRRGDPALRALSDGLRMGVRVDLPGTLLHDYHTTGGGTFHGGEQPEWWRDAYAGGVLSADGKVKRNQATKEPETDVSERFYLADASFLVALQGETCVIKQLAHALQQPVWPIFLGRKSCPPACPVYAGTGDYADLREALIRQPLHPRVAARGTRHPLRLLIETTAGQGNRQHDNIGVPAVRTFLPRFVAEEEWQPDGQTINTFE